MNEIIVSDSGEVKIPTIVKMQEFEVAELFELTYRGLQTAVKSILLSNICCGDYSQGGVIYGNIIYPKYYDLAFVTAIAFRVNTHRANIFRDYMLRKLIAPTAQPLFIQIGNANSDCTYN